MAPPSEKRDIDDLPKNSANYTALTPLWFLDRAALVHPNRLSVVHGRVRFTWADTYRRCRRLASALSRRNVGPGSTVAVIAPNIPAMYEAHFGVPMAGAVINAVNVRLNASTIAFLLDHSSAQVVMVDQEYFSLAEEAIKIMTKKKERAIKLPDLIIIGDENCDPGALQNALRKGVMEYEDFLNSGDPEYQWKPPEDEWQSIALGYTSGTTSSPKGVVLHHRGAYLMALSVAIVWGMNEGAVYLWTLPMFHCNGWCFTWSLAAFCGTNICLRQVTAKSIFSAITNQGVTHFCAAPVVLNSMLNAPKDDVCPLPRTINVMTAGAAPPPSLLAAMTERGFRVTHTYGLSETYGPSTVCAWKPEWDSLPLEQRARLHARQGVRYTGLESLDVVDTKTLTPVPSDGKTLGEIVMRGNLIMKGYLKNPEANREAFQGGWYHSGDLGVKHPDNYIEVKDRSKDIIISGGENISSVEVENVMHWHPAIMEVCVVARPDEQWGESPCAFVTLKEEFKKKKREDELRQELLKFCREKMPAYWVPKTLVFGELPKTATGKVQKHVLRAKAKEMGSVKKSRM